jgi:hypothetical protein
MESIEALSETVQARGAEYFASEAPAPPDSTRRFAAYFDGHLARHPEAASRIGPCVR